jgi:hypothetical protein
MARPVRISAFGLLSDFGLRVSGFSSFSLLLPWLFTLLALTTGAAIPAPEQLLPDDTLIMVTAPDFTKLRAICQKSPKSQLWSDPAMKPLRDKFESRWQEEVVKPIARELNVSLDSYASLPQGQLTFAVTKNAWQGNDDQPLGFLLLLDVRDKVSLLKTNLADFRKQWVGAGKTFKTETIRNLEFTVFPVTTNRIRTSLQRTRHPTGAGRSEPQVGHAARHAYCAADGEQGIGGWAGGLAAGGGQLDEDRGKGSHPANRRRAADAGGPGLLSSQPPGLLPGRALLWLGECESLR